MSRSRIASLLAQVSLEEAEVAAAAPAVVINVDVDTEPAVEDEIEIVAAADEVEDDSEVVDDLDEAAATLEAICEELHEAVQHGGLDPMGARRAHRELRGIQTRLGLESALPSLESFGGSSDRLRATTVSMEEANGTLAKVWQAIKNALIRVMDGLKDLFARLFGGFEKVSKRATELLAAVDKLEKDPSGKVKLATAGRLTLGGKFKPADTMVNVEDMYVTVGSKLVPNISGFINAMFNFIKTGDVEESIILNEIDERVGKLNTMVAANTEIAGGIGWTKRMFVKDAEQPYAVTIGSVNKEQIAMDQEVDAASRSELKTMLKAVVDVGAAVAKYKADQENISKNVKTALDVLDTLAKKDDASFYKRKKATMIYRGTVMLLSSVTSNCGKLAFTTSRAALTYAEKSIAATGSKSEATKD